MAAYAYVFTGPPVLYASLHKVERMVKLKDSTELAEIRLLVSP